MKYLIVVCLLFSSVYAKAQISLEHVYPLYYHFGLAEVDSGVWKYVGCDGKDSIALYNLDHSLDKIINLVRVSGKERSYDLIMVATGLFSLDDSYAYIADVVDTNGEDAVEICKEDGSVLFFRDSCGTGQTYSQANFDFPILRTDSGTKLILKDVKSKHFMVYSLPGKLPSDHAKLGILNDPSLAQSASFLPSSAYPNPSGGRVRITYELPPGIASGEIMLLTTDGKEVRRYRVTGAFNDLLIDTSDLPSGAYFYKVVTSKGESALNRIAIER